jgi:hypothetical protein
LRKILLPVIGIAIVMGLHLGARWAERLASDQMAAAAQAFLLTLSADQIVRTSFNAADDEVLRWHFIPPEMFPRAGIALRDLTPPQLDAARALLKAGLSQRGYQTAVDIMALEGVLRELEQEGRFARDPEAYYITIFGSPVSRGTWAWRFEGHHLSLHYAIVDGRATVSTPSFLGASPAQLPDGLRRGQRALAPPEDAAFALIHSLTPTQLQVAVLSDSAPPDILTGVQVPAPQLNPAGLQAVQMTPAQKELLRELIEAHSGIMNPEVAAARWGKINAAGFDAIFFAWAGARQRGTPHYYRIQGPSFLIEYDNTQNQGNHVHTVWRDFADDFGRDLLRQHLSSVPH